MLHASLQRNLTEAKHAANQISYCKLSSLNLLKHRAQALPGVNQATTVHSLQTVPAFWWCSPLLSALACTVPHHTLIILQGRTPASLTVGRLAA